MFFLLHGAKQALGSKRKALKVSFPNIAQCPGQQPGGGERVSLRSGDPSVLVCE